MSVRRLCIAVWGMLWAVALGAQERPDTVRLDPVVVTATRIPAPRSTVPAAVSVITAEELRATGARTVAEALRRVPGIATARTGSDGAATSLFLRGGESDYVQVLVDGVPLNEPGGAVDLADLSTAGIERIEVVRGPVSVLYGSDAVAGVVHVITRGGGNAGGGYLSADGGTHGTVDLRGEWSGRVGPVGLGAGVSRLRSDGIYPFNSDYANTVAHGRARVAPDDRTEILVALRSQESDFHYPTDGTGSLVDSNALQQRTGHSGSVEVGRRLTSVLEARVRVFAREGAFAIDDGPDHPGDLERLLLTRNVSRRAADLRVHARLPRAAVTVGAEVERQKETTATAWDGAFGPGEDAFDGARTNRGYYAEVQTGADRVGFTAGARVDRSVLFGTFVSYRAGAWVAPLRGVRLRAATGRGFKEPTFSEQLADSPYESGNPELRPERATGWEVGVEVSSPRDRWRVQTTAFTQRFRDLIQYAYAFGAPAGTPTYFNVAAADARGIEVEVQVVPAPWIVLDAGYTLLATEVVDAGLDADGAAFVTGERLLRRPAHALAAGAHGAAGRLALSGRVRWIGSRDDRDFSTYPASPAVLDGYAVADLGGEVTVLGQRSGGRSLAVGVRVENAFDADYQEAFGFRAPGRRVFAEARVRY